MGKAPAFQFYVSDWIIDTRMLSLSARGAWIDLLCEMWHSQTRGMLSLNWIGYARLLGVTVEQAKAAIGELLDLRVCDYEIDSDDEKMLPVTQCSKKVTVINRRMYREEKLRKNTRLRVYRHREKRAGNAHVTPLSSSSSSSSPTPPPPSPGKPGRGEVCVAPQQEAKNRKTETIPPAPSPIPMRGTADPRSSATADPLRGTETGACAFDRVKAFDEFWDAYPKSKFRPFARIPAEEAFFDVIKTGEEFRVLLAGLQVHRRSEGWQKDGGRFIVNPERFLRECRWQGIDAGNRPARRKMCSRCNREGAGPPFGLCGKCTKEKHDEEFWKEHGGAQADTGKATPSFLPPSGKTVKESEADERIAEFTRDFGRMK